jgi:hypothetical protein
MSEVMADFPYVPKAAPPALRGAGCGRPQAAVLAGATTKTSPGGVQLVTTAGDASGLK